MTELNTLEGSFSYSPVPTLVLQPDSNFTIIIANDAYLQAEKQLRTEVVGKKFGEVHRHSTEAEICITIFQSVLTEGTARQHKAKGRDISTYPILNESGKVVAIVLQLMSLPHHSSPAADTVLAQGPEPDLFEFSPVPMWVYDVDTLKIFAANKAALSDYGYSKEELLNTTVRILWPTPDIPRMEGMIVTKVHKELPNHATIRHVKKSGEVIIVNIESTPLPSWGRNARIVAALDVTDQLRAEQEVKENRDQLRSLLQTTNGIVWEADADTNTFRFVSDYVEILLGYSSSEWLSEANFWQQHVHPEDLSVAVNTRRSSFEKGKAHSAEYRMINARGNIVWIKDTFTPIIQNRKKVLRGLMVDITNVKRSMIVDQLDKKILSESAENDGSLSELVKVYIKGIEEQFPGISCSIMRVTTKGLKDWVSPSLPLSVITACEEQRFSTDSVVTGADDKEFSRFRDVIINSGYSYFRRYPIQNDQKEVMAVFFVYHHQSSDLSSEEVNIIERVSALLRVILERRQYLESLKETTMMMMQSQELAGLGNWSWDVSSDTISWSDTLNSIFGLAGKQVEPTLEVFMNLIHPDDRKLSLEAIEELLSTGRDKAFEERIVRPDGELRYLKTWAKVLYGEPEVVSRMIGASLDITESKQIQTDLLRSKSDLQKMLDRYLYVNKATNDAIYDWDIEADRIDWGESFSRIFGYKDLPDRYPLSNWFEIMHPDDLETVSRNLQRAILNKNQDRWSAEYRIKSPAGEYLYVEENGYLLWGDGEKAKRMIGVVRNITERKNAERELQLSNEKYADLFHLSPLPLFVYDFETLQILDVNRAAVEHYGYSFEEFLSFTLRDIRPPEDILILDEMMRNDVKPGYVHSSFTRHVKKSGKIILVNTKGNSIVYKGRDARIVVSIDNSERILAEEALLRSERRFKTMIQEGSDLITILDKEGNISYISPNISRLFNLQVRDFMLKNVFDYIHEDDHAVIKRQLLAIHEDEAVKVAPYRVRLKGGEIRWLETIITNKSQDPAVGGIIANTRDVTGRMKGILKNKALLDRYNAVSKATSDTIWDSNLATGRIIWNDSLREVFGYHETHTSLQWWREHVHPDDLERVNSFVEDHIRRCESKWTNEYRFRTANGSYKTVLDRGFIICSDAGVPIRMIGCMQDITDRVTYVNEIEQQNERLQEIAWMQSHLVRAPLARILGITEILNDEQNFGEEARELLSYLSVSSKELDDIIRGIVSRSHDV